MTVEWKPMVEQPCFPCVTFAQLSLNKDHSLFLYLGWVKQWTSPHHFCTSPACSNVSLPVWTQFDNNGVRVQTGTEGLIPRLARWAGTRTQGSQAVAKSMSAGYNYAVWWLFSEEKHYSITAKLFTQKTCRDMKYLHFKPFIFRGEAALFLPVSAQLYHRTSIFKSLKNRKRDVCMNNRGV